jgi:1,4-dihydroxy-2-naphthoyl-CoA synthase
MTYTTVLTEIRGRVGIVTLNRPQAMNAFNAVLLAELFDAMEAFDKDENINTGFDGEDEDGRNSMTLGLRRGLLSTT